MAAFPRPLPKVTGELATWVAGLRADAPPSEVVQRAKLIAADALASMVRTFVPIPEGEADNMLSAADVRAKFISLVERYLAAPAHEHVFQALVYLDDGATAQDIFRWTLASVE